MKNAKTLFIEGQWQSAAENATFADTNPANGSSLGQIADAGPADARQAVDAAAKAFATWRNETPFSRSKVLLRAAGILESRATEWAETRVAETGSIFGKAMYEIGFAASILRAASVQCRMPSGELLPSMNVGRRNLVERVPASVVVTISP